MSGKLIKITAFSLALTALNATQVDARSSTCDPELEAPKGDAFGYKQRAGRCEGRYVQEVSSLTLVVASLTSTLDNNMDSESWTVEWSAPGNADVRLRAQGLRSRLYYRMDARAGAAQTFSWPTELLAGLDIPAKDVGIVGWTRHPVGGSDLEVYLPLAVRSAGSPAKPSAGGYELVLVPGRELSEVYLSLAPLGDDGRPLEFLQDGEPLDYGYYPAGLGIEIALPKLTTSGLYYLELGATTAGGKAAAVELYFYHSDR